VDTALARRADVVPVHRRLGRVGGAWAIPLSLALTTATWFLAVATTWWMPAAAIAYAVLVIRPIVDAIARCGRRSVAGRSVERRFPSRVAGFGAVTAPTPFAGPTAVLLASLATIVWISGVGSSALVGSVRIGPAAAFASVIVAGWISHRGHVSTQVVFDETPFRIGRPAGMEFELLRPWRKVVFDRMTFTLQCIRVERILFGILPARHRRVFVEEITYGDEVPDGSFDVDLVFDVPADAPATDLAADSPVFWELEVVGDGPGVRYEERFRVPVYAADA
jgi:hypothetical protein